MLPRGRGCFSMPQQRRTLRSIVLLQRYPDAARSYIYAELKYGAPCEMVDELVPGMSRMLVDVADRHQVQI